VSIIRTPNISTLKFNTAQVHSHESQPLVNGFEFRKDKFLTVSYSGSKPFMTTIIIFSLISTS